MKNLIYQVWCGTLTEEAKVSSKLMKQYADRIGAEYLLHTNPNIASKRVNSDGPYWEWLNPTIDDSFLEYDNVLVLDLDIFPVEGLEENIFEQDFEDVGACTEPFQGKQRSTITVGGHINKENDEKWAKVIKDTWNVTLPRDDDGHLKVYNAGVVIFSNEGMRKARDWMPFQKYINLMKSRGLQRFYTVDQNYFHAMMFVNDIDFVEMNNGWNSQIHYIRGPLVDTNGNINDERNDDTKFVHVQMTGHKWNEKHLYEITNLPKSEWTFEYNKGKSK